jgi:23S rRNA (guanosine2251-2'-O)-methyltransferase
LFGRRAILEVLRAGRRKVHRLEVASGTAAEGPLKEALELAQRQAIPVRMLAREDLAAEARGGGLQALAEPYPLADVEEVLARCDRSPRPPLVLVLDQLQDPQNLGTVLRTAEAVEACGVLLPLRRAALVTPAVVNASAGAAEHLLIAQANLAQAIRRLQERDLWVVGLDSRPDLPALRDLDLSRRLAFVVGSEGGGLRRLVRDACDWVVRLPTSGRLESLNAAVAGSIALYAAWEARRRGASVIDASSPA